MSIETIYRVRKHNGELAGEYMDKKEADAHDQKLDGIFAIAELISEQAQDLDEAKADAIAEHLVNNKPAVMAALKKIKDRPAKDKPQAKAERDSNVEALEPKQAANAG